MPNKTSIHSLISAISPVEDETLPEWMHLIPAGEFAGQDGRGPFVVTSVEALIAASMLPGRKLPVDINHAIDHVGGYGGATPAQAWIVELQSREDGIWGRVEWTPEGAWAMASKAYGYVSPVFVHTTEDRPYKVQRLLRAALTNNPNLTLTALHTAGQLQTQEFDMLDQLRKALGLSETATEAEVLAAVSSAHNANQAHLALMTQIREAVGVPATVEGSSLVTAIQSRGKASPTEAENAELRTVVTSLQSQLTTLATTTARDKAETAIDAAIKEGKIVPALRDHMIARHMKAPDEVETELKHAVSLNAGGVPPRRQMQDGGVAMMTSADEQVLAQMGLDPDAFQKQAKTLHGKEA